MVLCALGAWQLQRLAWKQALIARVDDRLDAAPLPAPGPELWPTLDLAAQEYQPVEVSGRFDHSREVHVVYTLAEPKGPAGGVGFFVVTPLETADGWLVYVNRGFVPSSRADPATRSEGQIAGDTTVVGLFRVPARRSWFMPGDDAARNQWLSRDPSLYATAQGLPAARVAPYLIDARRDPALPGGLPQGGETVVGFRNDHLGYAITWFGLGAALAGVYGVFAWRRLKRQA